VFDIGATTSQALNRISTGGRVELAGGDDQFSKGNDSLMRILPVSLRIDGLPTSEFLARVHSASAVAHRHPRSLPTRGLYSLVVRELLAGIGGKAAVENALREFGSFYRSDPYWTVELDYFQSLLAGNPGRSPYVETDSSGCALKAVNLGGDTDTTGCVAGGLTGLRYGLGDVPEEWRTALARRDDVELLFDRFASTVLET
jgi:ADP-ribosylglycohydrolase